MFSFFKKSKPEPVSESFFPFTTDIHSHILPEIDDGAPDLETSIELIQGLISLGVKRSIATPHVISDLYRNNPQTINKALSALKTELVSREIDFELHAAAEYMLDSSFFELLEKDEPLMTLKDKIILTEFSYASRPDDPARHSFEINLAGYTPILAHPERYPYYYGNNEIYHRFVDLGFMLQINILSLTGHYGKEAAKACHYMLKNELVSFVATDLHHEKHMMMLQDPRHQAEFKKHLGHRNWNDYLD